MSHSSDVAAGLGAIGDPRGFLEALFEHAPIGLQLFRADGSVLLTNPEFERLFGVRPPADYNVLHDAQARARGVGQHIRLAFAGAAQRMPTIWYDPRENADAGGPGRRVAVDSAFFPLRDAAGRVTHVGAVYQDVTALKQSEERLRTTLLCIGDAVITTDDRGTVTSINAVASGLTGWPESEALSRPLPEVFAVVSEDSGARHPDTVARVLRGEGVQTLAARSELVRRDGKHVPISDSAAPITDESGAIIGAVVVFRDATAERETEHLLRASAERMRRLIDVSPDGVFVNRNGRISFVNHACVQLFGAASPEQLLGRSPFELIHPDSHPIVQKRMDLLLASDTTTPVVDEKIVRLDGRVVDVEVAAVSYMDGDSRVIQVVMRDATERKRLEAEQRTLAERIQHAQKLESLGVLAGGIAHDFNNLLMAVMGNADLALMRLAPESAARANVEQIEVAARRAADLTRQMLAYSGKGILQVVPINLSRSVEEMAHLLHVSVSKRAVLKYHFAANLPMAEADPGQITQIVMNLITNASEAIGDRSGVVTVSTGVMHADRPYLQSCVIDDDLPEGAYVYVEVSDTGHGMSAETRARIFEPFYTTKFTGRGLGLSAVLGIVRSHRGTVRVYSELGRGTTIKVLFPARGAAGIGDEELPAPAHRTGQGTILVVDDEESVRTVAQMILEEFGYHVLAAEDGRRGLEIYREAADRIALVLLDMTMPHMDGEETFRELRRIRADVRVILSSGYSEQDATVQFSGKGLAGFLQKPYRPRQLIELVRQALNPAG